MQSQSSVTQIMIDLLNAEQQRGLRYRDALQRIIGVLEAESTNNLALDVIANIAQEAIQ